MNSQKFANILKLLRLNTPTGDISVIKFIYLTFFPACWGFQLTSSKEYYFLILFFIGSLSTRGMGCIINDYFDRDFDNKVTRTKDRPLANRSIDLKLASLLFIICTFVSLLILLSLNITCIYIGIVCAGMMTIYPLFKRFSNFPQIFLGFTFNLGALIGYAAITNCIDIVVILLYLGCCMWTVGFDTIYGFMDIEDDQKIKIKSFSIFIQNKKYRLIIGLTYLAFITLFVTANLINRVVANVPILLIGVSIAFLILIWQILTLDITNPNNCLKRFNANNLVGLTLMITMFLSNN